MNDLIPKDKLLVAFENIAKSLAEVDDLKQLQAIQANGDGFEHAWQKYYRSSGFGFEQMFGGWEVKVRAERRMGELLPGKIQQGRPKTFQDERIKLEDLGISEIQSHRYQLLARIPIDEFEKGIDEFRNNFKEPTTSGLLRIPFVGENRGQYEWYTPPKFTEAATRVMGEITLDPASADKANELVKAKKYFTELDNGLEQKWEGSVWLNPPYAQPLIDDFSKAVVEKYQKGEFKQACIFVNNATETVWFQRMLTIASAICLIKGRVKCLNNKLQEVEDSGPLQGQVVIYIGNNKKEFKENFKQFGIILSND